MPCWSGVASKVLGGYFARQFLNGLGVAPSLRAAGTFCFLLGNGSTFNSGSGARSGPELFLCIRAGGTWVSGCRARWFHRGTGFCVRLSGAPVYASPCCSLHAVPGWEVPDPLKWVLHIPYPFPQRRLLSRAVGWPWLEALPWLLFHRLSPVSSCKRSSCYLRDQRAVAKLVASCSASTGASSAPCFAPSLPQSHSSCFFKKLINLFYFTILYWFCHSSFWLKDFSYSVFCPLSAG